jgi:uncharacterized protein YjdB
MTTIRRLARLAPLALLPSLLLSACTTSDDKSPTLAFLELVPKSAFTLQEGETRRLTVIGTYSDGSVLPLTTGVEFSSSDPSKASVAPDGTVTAVAVGSATIIATSGRRTATASVTVIAGPPRLLSIAVTPATAALFVGGPGQALTVTATFSSGPATDVTSSSTFSSSDAATASVSAAGVVTPVAAGSATITATYSGLTAAAAVTVAVPVLQSIAVTPAAPTLAVGATQALTVTATYDVGPTANVTSSAAYATSDAATATVSPAGVVTAVATGTATITATYSGQTATSVVTVAAPVLQSISVAPATISLPVGGTQALTVTATFDVGPDADVTSAATYATSDAGVATVDAAGVVTAVAVGGPATITATYSGTTATAAVTVSAISTTGGLVFFGDFDPGVSFAPFGGSTNDVARDTVELNPASAGRASLRVVVPNGNYTGGALVASAPRDLRAFNALTFWAKASTANLLNVAGLGDNAATTPPPFSAEVVNFPLTGTWTKFVVPLPDPSKLVDSNGLFHFAEGGDNYTIWFSDIQYESLPASEVGAPTGATLNWPGAQALATGSTFQIPYQPNTVSFDTPALPDGGSLKNVSFGWYTLGNTDPTVASVSPTGLVTGLAAGTTTISATMNGIALPGDVVFTVTAPLAVPTTIAPTPTVPAANVISLFSSAYTNQGVDTWQTSWSAGNSVLVDPFTIAGHDVKKYTLSNFVGIEFGLADPANTVDATAMTHFHVDVWSPNPPANLEIQLVNDPGGAAQHIGRFQAGAIANGSWVSLEIPLGSFTDLTTREALRQLLFVASGPTVIYVDNVYFHN